MAIAIFSDRIEMTAAGDEVTGQWRVKSIRVVSAAPTDGDQVEMTNVAAVPVTIWETFISGTNEYAEEALVERWWKRGIRLNTNTGNRAIVSVYYY